MTPLVDDRAAARLIESLRHTTAGRSAGAVMTFGDERIDSHLPAGGLGLGLLHEMVAVGLEREMGAIGGAFITSLLARLPNHQPIAWIAPVCDLYPPGLMEFGLDPGRLLFVRTRDDAMTLGVMETALRAGCLGAVVGEVDRLGRLAGRRLHLACLKQDVTGFVLRRSAYGQQVGRARPQEGTAAATRWLISAEPTQTDSKGPGPPRWRLELLHARGGREGAWIMEVTDAHALRVVAELADDTAAAQPQRAER